MIRSSILAWVITLGAVGQPSGIEWWHKSWSAAFEEARARNVPVMVAFIMDGEEANDRIVTGLYPDEAFIKLCDRVVPIVVSISVHAPMRQEIRGTTESVCSKFGSVTCSRHKELEMEARALCWNNKEVRTPSHVFLLPNGDEAGRIIDVHSYSAYEAAVHDAQKSLGRGLSRDEFRTIQEGLRAARGALERNELGEVVERISDIERLAAGTPFAGELEELHAAMTRKGDALVARVEAFAAKRQALEALQLIEDGLAAFKGTAIARELRSLESRVKRTPEGRQAAKQLQLAEKARPYMAKATAAEKERDFLRAYLNYVRILRTAGETALGKEAHRRMMKLLDDPDVAPLIAKRREADAQRSFDAAKRLWDSGSKISARKKLEQVLRCYEGTAAAAAARKLLESDG